MDAAAWMALRGDFRFDRDRMAQGAIIGVCELLTCTKELGSVWHEDGLWGWYLKNARRFDEAIPYKGQLRLFNVPDEVVKEAL